MKEYKAPELEICKIAVEDIMDESNENIFGGGGDVNVDLDDLFQQN